MFCMNQPGRLKVGSRWPLGVRQVPQNRPSGVHYGGLNHPLGVLYEPLGVRWGFLREVIVDGGGGGVGAERQGRPLRLSSTHGQGHELTKQIVITS